MSRKTTNGSATASATERASEEVVTRTLANRRRGRTDWAAVDALTDDEIRAAVAADPDAAPILDAAWFAAAERHMPRTTAVISIRVDEDVLAWFKAQGRGYQPRMNAVLRGYMEAHDERGR